jgi:FAD/FMN-containing dehydrogenase
MTATRASGTNAVRYGTMRDNVLGLTVVMADGTVIRTGGRAKKSSAGYDLTRLLVGSEGTLGIITEATLRLTRAPAESAVMVLGLTRLQDLIPVLVAFQARLTLNAFEFFTEETLARVVERHGLQRPFAIATPVYALVDFEAGSEIELENALGAYEHCREGGWVSDATISQSRGQAHALWRLRDDISETLSRWSPYKNDLSVRISLVPEFLSAVSGVVAEACPDFEVLWYGHIGDGNVHLNILKPGKMALEEFKAHCAKVSERIFEKTQAFGGSISAEHGVGLLKKPYLAYSRSQQQIVLMRTIKQALDPNGVMNPGKIFE